MTDRQPKRSRRRFIADLLFAGGGLTAAALLAKHQFLEPRPEPPLPGNMVAPPPPQSTGKVQTVTSNPSSSASPSFRSCDPPPSHQVIHSPNNHPAAKGDYALPTDPSIAGGMTAPPPAPPNR